VDVVEIKHLRHGKLCLYAKQIQISVRPTLVPALINNARSAGQLPAHCCGLIALRNLFWRQVYKHGMSYLKWRFIV
jgi:hypothetical protein